MCPLELKAMTCRPDLCSLEVRRDQTSNTLAVSHRLMSLRSLAMDVIDISTTSCMAFSERMPNENTATRRHIESGSELESEIVSVLLAQLIPMPGI